MSRAITGQQDYLLPYLEDAIREAVNIRFNVAFLMESGVKLLTPSLLDAVKRGVRVKILTGRYMSVTEPSAIYYLRDQLGDALDIRFYEDIFRSFHPKAYILDGKCNAGVFVGSSNISRSALTHGIEWNHYFKKSASPEAYDKFSNTFDELFLRRSVPITENVLKEYASTWKKPHFIRIEDALDPSAKEKERDTPEPRGAQIEALYELRQARDEGITKALVVAATGVGKTYLAAFDSINFKRILFVAHREEILRQAEMSFLNIRPQLKTGYFTGFQKDISADAYFATIQTLNRKPNIQQFSPNYFDYIIVDEFHHAAANSYLSVLEYFHPKFLLGLTATPYRTDNRDIFALCEDNIVYEIYLKDAINRDLLVPFKYYGIFDGATDYGEIRYQNGRYVVDELETQLSRKERAALILQKYRRLAKAKTLGFCASIKHANYMATYFSQNGVPSVAVHSGEGTQYVLDRHHAIEQLVTGRAKVVFCVDIFNEGVDIPTVDTVMFLRPTESFVVFMQQLGRGLRKAPNKDYLTVLDFIGNYKRAHYVPALLAGDNPMQINANRGKQPTDYDYPEMCQVYFDFQVLDLFEEMKKYDPLSKRMEDDYFRIKASLERRPSRLDIFEGSDIPIREFLKTGWLRFLSDIGEASAEEVEWLDAPAENFLRELERTSMTKSYKIPTLMAFKKGNTLTNEATLKEIGKSFYDFYYSYPLHQADLRNNKRTQGWREWGISEFSKLAKDNPINFLSRSKFFHYDEVNKVFSFPDILREYLSPLYTAHFNDILEYRRRNFSKRYKS